MHDRCLVAGLWTVLVPAAITSGITLIVLLVRAALENRAAGLADVASALAVGVAVAVVAGLVPHVLLRRGVSWVSGTSVVPSGTVPREDVVRWQKFDDAARKALTNAQTEAVRLDHNYMGTEHLLLGLLRDPGSVAGRALRNLGMDLDKARETVELIIGRGGDPPASGELGLTPRAKRVIELGIDEARRRGDDFIGSEHLLLGLVLEGEGIAAGVLESFGVTLEQVREEVARRDV